MENLTPMLRQYQEIKQKHKDGILFFRLGDFYEMFYEDARKASAILDLVLTARGTDSSGKVPMCGIPFHSADSYISRLVKAGMKVAICEQVEDPSLAKGIVRREVIREITAGTFIDENAYSNRYLICVCPSRKGFGLALTDNASGIIQANQAPTQEQAADLIGKLPVYECIYPESQQEETLQLFKTPLLRNKNIKLTPFAEWCFNRDMAYKSLLEHFGTGSLRGFEIEELPLAISCSGALLEYLKQMNHQPVRHIDRISLLNDSDFVFISPSACYGLELENLFTCIDRTVSAMGRRRLKDWLWRPLVPVEKIKQRQQAVLLLKDNPVIADELASALTGMPDIEKSIWRISSGSSGVKDLLALHTALSRIPDLQRCLADISVENPLFSLKDIPEIRELICSAIDPQVPLAHPEGRIIKSGYNKELDELRSLQDNGRQWLKKLQEEEVKRTRINSLKIGYNQVFGYYIEISKANLHLVPEDYIRKQTLVNAERFITPQIKEFEEKMLSAEDKLLALERTLIRGIENRLLDGSSRLHTLAFEISLLDALLSLSRLACEGKYCLPKITLDNQIIIKEGRHPVVERSIQEAFIPNDTLLDCEANRLLIITGPNMAGKSTYIRQTAVLVIMAQMGSLIPAQEASIGIVDKVFTRIGAHDDITKGQSTFMVEMSEAASILNNLSARSLVILDEIGRGTSTYDGLSLAWAIAEYLQKQGVRTLFATHFHELTSLAGELSGVKNFNVEVRKWEDRIIFLHRIVPGGTDDSYGIYVAKLAGIPEEVIKRSKNILGELELQNEHAHKIKGQSAETQLPLFDPDEPLKQIGRELDSMRIESLTPMQALNILSKWKDNGRKK